MHVEDYYQNGIKRWFRLHEKGGKRHEVLAHHNADQYVHAYFEAAGIAPEKKTPSSAASTSTASSNYSRISTTERRQD
jgi:hypothetical protein